MTDEIKVRIKNGVCYYIDENPDSNGDHHGEAKHSGRKARLRWVNDEWIVIWEEEFKLER